MTSGKTKIPPHCTVYLSPDGFQVTVISEENGADFLFMSGEPLQQNVAAGNGKFGKAGESICRI